MSVTWRRTAAGVWVVVGPVDVVRPGATVVVPRRDGSTSVVTIEWTGRSFPCTDGCGEMLRYGYPAAEPPGLEDPPAARHAVADLAGAVAAVLVASLSGDDPQPVLTEAWAVLRDLAGDADLGTDVAAGVLEAPGFIPAAAPYGERLRALGAGLLELGDEARSST